MKAILFASALALSVLGSVANAELKPVLPARVAAFAATVDQTILDKRYSICADYRYLSDRYNDISLALKKADAAYVDDSGAAPAVVVASPTGAGTRVAYALYTTADHKTPVEFRIESQEMRDVNISSDLTNPVIVREFYTVSFMSCSLN